MKMPAISQAQLLAVASWAITQGVAYGLIDVTQEKVIVTFASSIIAAAWMFADGWRHHGNAKVKAAAIASPDDTAAELKKVNAA